MNIKTTFPQENWNAYPAHTHIPSWPKIPGPNPACTSATAHFLLFIVLHRATSPSRHELQHETLAPTSETESNAGTGSQHPPRAHLEGEQGKAEGGDTVQTAELCAEAHFGKPHKAHSASHKLGICHGTGSAPQVPAEHSPSYKGSNPVLKRPQCRGGRSRLWNVHSQLLHTGLSTTFSPKRTY